MAPFSVHWWLPCNLWLLWFAGIHSETSKSITTDQQQILVLYVNDSTLNDSTHRNIHHLCTPASHENASTLFSVFVDLDILQTINGNNYHLQPWSLANKETTPSASTATVCPIKAWDYFLWSIQEWWLIYIFVMLIGTVLGALLIALVILCYWKYKKHEWAKQIVEEYRERKKNDKVHQKKSKKPIDLIDLHDANTKHKRNYEAVKQEDINEQELEHHHHYHSKRKRDRKKKSSVKYTLVSDVATDLVLGHDDEHDRHDSNGHPKKHKKRRKTLPPGNQLDIVITSPHHDEHGDDKSREVARMRSNSDPFKIHRKESKHERGRRSMGNVEHHHEHHGKHRDKSRSRSPMKARYRTHPPEDANYEQYRFQPNNQLLQPLPPWSEQHDAPKEERRHSSKSSQKDERRQRSKSNKTNKRKRSKSPAMEDKEHRHQNSKNGKKERHTEEALTVKEQQVNIIVNHYHSSPTVLYNNQSNNGTQIANMSDMKTKKSIGISLSALKDRNYEDNRRESLSSESGAVNNVEMMQANIIPIEQSPHMIIHEGVASDMKTKNEEDTAKKGHHRNGGGGSNYMGSLTNKNDEGINGIDAILSDMQRIKEENEEESSSFTIQSGDKITSSSPKLQTAAKSRSSDRNHDEPEKDGASTNRTTLRLPRQMTKGQWL